MKLAINAIPYVRWSGIETFLYNLLKNWTHNPQDEVVVFTNQEFANFLTGLPNHIKIEVINFKKTGRLNFFIFQQFRFPFLLKKKGFDLLFCASLLTPWCYRKKIITIHDAAPFVLKEENSFLAKIFWRANLFFGKITSLKIMTVSEFSKQELIKHLGIKPEKIEIIYNGSPVYNATSADRIKDYSYILTIGNARPRKNLQRLIEAFEVVTKTKPELKLLIVGKKDWRMEEIISAYPNLKDSLIFTGFVSEEEKAKLISQAELLAFPSLYEGFGLPIVEANVLKTPITCSDIPSFREVAGDSATFFNPLNKEDIAKKILTILNSPELANNLISKGKNNCQRFSWQESSSKLAKIIHSYETPANK